MGGMNLHILKRLHNCNFNILGASLDDFQERLDGEFDGLFTVHILLVVSLQEFSDGLAGSADGIRFPTCELTPIPYNQRAQPS